MIDNRIVEVDITINNEATRISGLYIAATGNQLSVPGAGQCEVKILNPSNRLRELILRETNPLAGKGSTVYISVLVGRESYGASELFSGTVFRSSGLPRPNLGIILKCIGGNIRQSQSKYVTRTGGDETPLKTIAEWAAIDAGYSLNFDTDNLVIGSYSYSGSAQGQIEKLYELSAGARVYEERGVLNVVSMGAETLDTIPVLSAQSGLMEASRTEHGVRAMFLYMPAVKIGKRFEVQSITNPSLNGVYSILRLDYAVSNRDTPFYYVAEMAKL